MVYLTGAILAAILALLLLSRRVSPSPQSEELSFLGKRFDQAAGLVLGIAERGRAGRRIIRCPAKVRADLKTLFPFIRGDQAEYSFMRERLRDGLMLLFAACVVSFALSLREQGEAAPVRRIARGDYGEREETVTLTADVPGTDLGEFAVSVKARRYSREEAAALASELTARLPELILGDNASLLEVRENLRLRSGEEGYPFTIRWSCEPYGLIRSGGAIDRGAVEDSDAPLEAVLTASLTYGEFGEKVRIPVTVLPVPREDEEPAEVLARLLQDAEEAGAEEPEFVLPAELPASSGYLPVIWRKKEPRYAALAFGLIAACAILQTRLGGYDLHRRVEARTRRLIREYPALVSRLVLYVGAGLNVRNSFAAIAGNYMKARAEGGEEQCVGEELVLMLREMESGVREAEAIAHFAARCRAVPYTRFSTLLLQNLTKGNSALLELLEQETKEAYKERQLAARRLGEEAGTKLLLPMMLFLIMTMLMIMIPAYQSFM